MKKILRHKDLEKQKESKFSVVVGKEKQSERDRKY